MTERTAIAPTPEQVNDPVWRLCNGFYQIRLESGKPGPFWPDEDQRALIEEIYVHGTKDIVIVKARQRGMSTLLALIVLDTLLFSTSVEVQLTDYNANNAKKKLTEKVFYAFDRLPPILRQRWTVYARSKQHGEFSIGPAIEGEPRKPFEKPDDMGGEKPFSTFIAGETSRGGTFQLSWFSEWWETAARFPQRSSDILLAGWPAGEQGTRIVETTVHGGKRGDVWNLIKSSLDARDNPLPRHMLPPGAPLVMFVPWWKAPKYSLPGSESFVREETREYFAKLTRITGQPFTVGQMLFYQSQADKLGVFVKGQYPSTIEECWDAPVKGAIWVDALAKAQRDGRIRDVPHDPALEVDTFWDLGAPDNTATLYVQHNRLMRHLIDFDVGLQLDLPDRVRYMVAKGYRYGTHYLPHDAGARQKNGVSFQAEFEAELARQGCSGRTVVLQQCASVWDGVNRANYMLSNYVHIDERKCAQFLDAARLYRRKADPTNPELFLNEVVKDWTTHSADTLRYLAEAAIAEHLPHTSNGVMNNCYFDSLRLANVIATVTEHPPLLWTIDHHGDTFRQMTARRDDRGWLRVWEDPRAGHNYLVAVVNGAVGVLRAAGWSSQTGSEMPHVLAAACVVEQGINRDMLIEWTTLMAAHYGDCAVAVDIESLPGAVDALRPMGCQILARRQSEQDRRIGQSSVVKKFGYEIDKEGRLEYLACLQREWRESRVEVWCPHTLRQMQGIIDQDGQPRLVDDGQRENWVMMLALAVSQAGQATAWRPRQVIRGGSQFGVAGYGGERKMPFQKPKMRS